MAFNKLTMDCSSVFALEASSFARHNFNLAISMALITSSLVMAVSLSVYDSLSDKLQESVL